jgi:hypothetical protein
MSKAARPTTPEEEGVELHPGLDRFERLFDKVVKAPPVHRTGKPTDADQPGKPPGRSNAKSSR